MKINVDLNVFGGDRLYRNTLWMRDAVDNFMLLSYTFPKSNERGCVTLYKLEVGFRATKAFVTMNQYFMISEQKSPFLCAYL